MGKNYSAVMNAFRYVIFINLLYVCLPAWGVSSLHFLHYQNGILSMNLVTPTIEGDVLLENENGTRTLQGARLVNLFSLEVPVACSLLERRSTLYWLSPGNSPLEAVIPPQVCQPKLSVPVLPPVRMMRQGGRCIIDTGGNTLWRVASEMAVVNHFTVQQNVYAIFLINRSEFAGEDIHRLKSHKLKCPSLAQFKLVEAKHAKRLFSESLK